MSNLQNDTQRISTDAKAAVTAERRRLISRFLEWLRSHPRALVAVIVVLALIAATLGFARG